MDNRHDIKSSDDIKLLIDTFYQQVVDDVEIGYIFTDIAKVDWDSHLPRMYAFWEFLLLGSDTYRGNPMEVHRHLNEKIALTRAHFDRWIKIFHETVDCLFQGENADNAKARALAVALTWAPKFEMENRLSGK